MVRFFIVFMLLLVGMFWLRLATHDWITLPFTNLLAMVSGFLITLFDGNAVSEGIIIRSTTNGFAVAIAPGCDGIEAVIILFAAILAFPAPWKHKLAGMGIGFLAIQALNLVRIISLFYMGQWNRTAFDWFHLYLWQALIVLDALAVWLIWLRYLPRRAAPPPAPPPEPAAAAG